MSFTPGRSFLLPRLDSFTPAAALRRLIISSVTNRLNTSKGDSDELDRRINRMKASVRGNSSRRKHSVFGSIFTNKLIFFFNLSSLGGIFVCDLLLHTSSSTQADVSMIDVETEEDQCLVRNVDDNRLTSS